MDATSCSCKGAGRVVGAHGADLLHGGCFSPHAKRSSHVSLSSFPRNRLDALPDVRPSYLLVLDRLLHGLSLNKLLKKSAWESKIGAEARVGLVSRSGLG